LRCGDLGKRGETVKKGGGEKKGKRNWGEVGGEKKNYVKSKQKG